MGYVTDKYAQSRNFRPMLGLMFLVNFAFIYIPGLLGLGLWMYLVKGTFPTFLTLISMGLLPFILGDLLKIGGAAALTKAITQKKNIKPLKNRFLILIKSIWIFSYGGKTRRMPILIP